MSALDPYETRVLNAESVSFGRNESGVLQAVIDGVDYAEVALTRVFPLSQPDRYIVVSVPDGDEIGMIEDLQKLSTETRRHAEQELRLRYVVPIVKQVHRISQEPGMWRWHVTTDRGDIELMMPNLHDHVQTVSADRLLVTDVDGRRCEVRISALDGRSRMQLKKVQ